MHTQIIFLKETMASKLFTLQQNFLQSRGIPESRQATELLWLQLNWIPDVLASSSILIPRF